MSTVNLSMSISFLFKENTSHISLRGSAIPDLATNSTRKSDRGVLVLVTTVVG